MGHTGDAQDQLSTGLLNLRAKEKKRRRKIEKAHKQRNLTHGILGSFWSVDPICLRGIKYLPEGT
jgi:hypothetical protein